MKRKFINYRLSIFYGLHKLNTDRTPTEFVPSVPNHTLQCSALEPRNPRLLARKKWEWTALSRESDTHVFFLTHPLLKIQTPHFPPAAGVQSGPSERRGGPRATSIKTELGYRCRCYSNRSRSRHINNKHTNILHINMEV